MKKKIVFAIVFALPLILASCGGNNKAAEGAAQSSDDAGGASAVTSTNTAEYDPKRGEGKFDESNVEAGDLDAGMATRGKAIAEIKCFSCHKPTEEKLVGPGWKGVTLKHPLYWIMNFITNPDGMIDKDPELQAQLEICLVRMPNQNLNDSEARSVVEFMRQNDGAK